MTYSPTNKIVVYVYGVKMVCPVDGRGSSVINGDMSEYRLNHFCQWQRESISIEFVALIAEM